jgi:hypothetical protein
MLNPRGLSKRLGERTADRRWPSWRLAEHPVFREGGGQTFAKAAILRVRILDLVLGSDSYQ